MRLIDTKKAVTDMHALAWLLRNSYVDKYGHINLYKGTIEQMLIVAGYFFMLEGEEHETTTD